VLALDELTFTEIARLRSNQRLRESIQAIARTAAADESADGETSPAAAADHVAAVERWGRTLTEAVVEAKLSKRLLPSRGGSLGKLSKARPIFVSAINLGVRLLSHAHLGLGKKALDGASEAARLAFEASLPIAAKFYVRDVGQGLQILVKEVTKATKANVSISA